MLQRTIQTSKDAGLERELTGTTLACLGKTEEDLTDRISPATGDEEEDAADSVVDAGSIPSLQMDGTTRRTSWRPRVGARVTREAGQNGIGHGDA
jgi:hypothetical protein